MDAISLGNISETLFSVVPQAGEAFDQFVENRTPRDFSWDDVDFDLHEFIMYSFTAPIFIPAIRQLPLHALGIEACVRFTEMMAESGSELVRYVLWFEVLEPLLVSVVLFKNFYDAAGAKTRSAIEEMASVNGIYLP